MSTKVMTNRLVRWGTGLSYGLVVGRQWGTHQSHTSRTLSVTNGCYWWGTTRKVLHL